MDPPAPQPAGIKAVIFDVYGTLLSVADGTAGERAWQELMSAFRLSHEVSLAAFQKACSWHTAKDHAVARLTGEAHPEVNWASIALRCIPALTQLSEGELDRFLRGHARILRQGTPMPGALEFLSHCRSAGLITGIASNAQPYTRHELLDAGFSMDLFDPVFLSGDHGYAKPSPRIFAFLTKAMAARHVIPSATMMVGDRADNDILPALAAGWQTWHFAPTPGRDFPALSSWLFPRED